MKPRIGRPLHEARVAFLASHGWSEVDCGGVSLILGDAVLVYKAEAFAGDILRFEVAAGEPGALEQIRAAVAAQAAPNG